MRKLNQYPLAKDGLMSSKHFRKSLMMEHICGSQIDEKLYNMINDETGFGEEIQFLKMR